MREIKKVMTVLYNYSEEDLKTVRELFHPAEVVSISLRDNEGIVEALKTADVAFIWGDPDERYLNAKNLKWIHCGHAGLNRFAKKELFDHGLIVTSSAGRSAPALAEHIIMFILAHTYRFDKMFDAQRGHEWGFEGIQDLRGACGKTLGILGMGNNGVELAKRAKAMDMEILAYDVREEKPDNVDEYFSMAKGENYDEILKRCDFLALCLPLNNKTYHMISEREFKLMKETACIINMARGAIIDEEAMVKALKEGWIGGAGLDVFEQEPLPKDSALWDMPNVFITPHTTPQVPDRTSKVLSILKENIRRYRNEEKMINQLTQADIFDKVPTQSLEEMYRKYNQKNQKT